MSGDFGAAGFSPLLENAGLALMLVCMFGQFWNLLDAGSRKNSELVTSGPHSITRNPHYLFSVAGIFGGSLVRPGRS